MEMFIKLGLKEVASIINTLGISTDIMYQHGCIQVDGKLYVYEKKGNELIISSEDGKKVSVAINYEEQETKDYQNRPIIYLKHEVLINYLFENGERISLYKNVALDRGYEEFENVHRHDLLSGIKTNYVNSNGEELASFSMEVGKVCLAGSNKVYEFTPEGIVCGNRLITTDGDKLISISGEKTPDMDVITSFHIDKERAKLEQLLKSGIQLHPFTRELVHDAYRKLDRKDRYAKDIISYYDEDIKDVRRALAVRNRIIDAVNKGVIPSSVLETVGNKFREEVINNKGNGMKF